MDPASSSTASISKPFRLSRLTWRHVLGFAIVISGAAILLMALIGAFPINNPGMRGALVGGSIAALATALRTLPVLLSTQFSQRTYDSMLGFGASVMLAASSFSLIIPALAAAKSQGSGLWGAGGLVSGGIIVGELMLMVIDRIVPHEHFEKGLEGPETKAMKRVWLFVLAICLHNLPEDLAIGVAYAGTDPVGALALATGITIQDVPEGMAVALALRSVGYGRVTSAGLDVLSGLVEPVMAMLGTAMISLSAAFLPWGLAAAAGAMLYVISHEIIPESHHKGHEAYATGGVIFRFLTMILF